jgi:acyl-CoA-binding protein
MRRAKRAKTPYEAKDVAAGAGRMIRGLVNRAGTGDQEALYELVQLQAKLQDAVNEAGARMHVQAGYSYTTLAGELGITRQAARQRFAPYVAQLKAERESA